MRHKEKKPVGTLTLQIPTVDEMPVGLQRVADAMADPDTKEGHWVGNWFYMHEPVNNFHPEVDADDWARKQCMIRGFDSESCEGSKNYDGVTTRSQFMAHKNALIDEWFKTHEEALKAKGYSIH